MKRLTGKKILITGASEGLGRAMAISYAKENAEVLSLVARNKVQLNKTVEEIKNISEAIQVIPIAADVSIPADIGRMVATSLEAFKGRIDVLVNNASVIGPSPMPYLLDYPLDEFQKVLNTNLIGPYLIIRNALPSMIENGGSIINVTSDAGIVGYPGWGAYGISKFGLEGMSQTWAAELQETSVRVNWVDPGDMNTRMHRAAEPNEDPYQWADPEDVVDIFIYLASDESMGVSGNRFQAQENWQEVIKVRSS